MVMTIIIIFLIDYPDRLSCVNIRTGTGIIIIFIAIKLFLVNFPTKRLHCENHAGFNCQFPTQFSDDAVILKARVMKARGNELYSYVTCFLSKDMHRCSEK